MKKIKSVFLLAGLFLVLAWSGVSAAGLPRIDSPLQWGYLQGVVQIDGNTDLPDFQSYEVSFSYDRTDTNTWFLISQSRQSVTNGTLGSWDTTTITDGTYKLRLVVTLRDGSSNQVVVSALQVGNYTAVIQPQRTLTAATQVVFQSTPTPTDRPTATSLPPNPAAVTRGDILSSMTDGVIFALGIFLVLGVYLVMRTLRRR